MKPKFLIEVKDDVLYQYQYYDFNNHADKNENVLTNNVVTNKHNNDSPHPVFGFIACPNCKAPASDITEKSFRDKYHTMLIVNCQKCGWTEKAEV